MARPAKLWFRASRNAWFVEIRGKQHNLGADEVEAKRRFHALMAQPEPKPAPPPSLSIADICERFLEWCSRHRSAGTYQWSKCRIQWFINAIGNFARQPVDSLKPFHVVEWIDKHPDWSRTYRHGLIAAVQRPFNWAVRLGYIASNPIRFIEKPGVQRREQLITPADWITIRDHYPAGDAFRAVLEWAWECGARPQEAKGIEASHVQLDLHRIFIPKEEAKGKKKPRIIYMTPRAEEIIVQLTTLRPSGPLFLNAKGRPWTSFAMNCRFCRLQMALGRLRMKELGIKPSKAKDPKVREKENRELQSAHGIKFAAYSLRHGFCQRKLEDGLDIMTVASLMGHSGTQMIERHYSHMDKADKYLHASLNRG